ncbi:MAG: hypothetical protein WCE62_10380 [Polyangiales bacterium]
MSTQPRMSAPIGRLRIRTSEGRARGGSNTGRWKSADSPTDSEVSEVAEARRDDARPRFYPFPLRQRGQHDD